MGSQIRISPSSPAEASQDPLGATANATTPPVWPTRVRPAVLVAGVQIRRSTSKTVRRTWSSKAKWRGAVLRPAGLSDVAFCCLLCPVASVVARSLLWTGQDGMLRSAGEQRVVGPSSRGLRQTQRAMTGRDGYCTSKEKSGTLPQWPGQCEVISAGVGVEKFGDDG